MIRRAFLSSLRYTASHTSAVAPRSHRRIPTDLCYGLARIMTPAPVPGFGARLELHGLDVWPGDNEVVLDAAHGGVVIAELRRLLHSS